MIIEMGIFKNIFRSKEKEIETVSPANSNYNSAKKAFDEGNYKETLRLLVAAFSADPAYKACYELAALAIDKLGGQDEASLFRNAISDFENYKPFYDLGYHYVDVEHNRLAIPFLERAMELSENSIEVAMELAVAYCSQFMPEKGMEVLGKAEGERGFWNLYEFYWCSLLSGEVDGIDEFVNGARNRFEEISDNNDPEIKNKLVGAFYVLDKMEECYNRYKTIDKPEKIIKHWHYIQYGAAILDYFDEKTSDEALKVAGGRYVTKFGSYSEVKMMACKLREYLTKMEHLPERICSLPGRDSEILGKIIAKVFNLKWEQYDMGKNTNKCLVVAGNNSDFNDYYEQFNTINNEQITFAMNHNWLEKSYITPDISGFMTQTFVFPWNGGGLKVNQETKQVESVPQHEGTVEEIVEAIMMENGDIEKSFDEILDFYYKRRDYLKGSSKGGTKRLQFIIDSPVKGSYFC